ncbi:uncharacterized protein [Venturia canescens]|uniref:uncharacterized protein isoform X2 n=1 Tax=Venturia canescens TaxID=32260 RepID=UPI001C9C0116|nr:uncharacterized protein LOC122406046 isoform X2 [Venturia canescens]XP_043267140.1 uncharacterized protein LOC122406046 isoform X2 [Venturia canescens]
MIDNESSMGSLFSHGRTAQQDNRDPGVGFNLPREVIQRRENVWNNFFDKYNNKVPNDVVLNMLTMEPVESVSNENNNEEEEGDDEDNDEDDDEDNDEDNKEYYSKCRAPIRKLPALIQYWVDTGNPPYQLTGDENHSDTGSSLSEGEYSRSNQSAALRKSIEEPKFDENSPYSSVDTAAYVLSNTNVTEKAKTQEIVEGAKKSNEHLCPKVAAPTQEDRNASKVADEASKLNENRSSNEILKTPQKSAPLNCMISPGGSVMLCEVLPALQQFDDLLEKSEQLKKPSSTFSMVRRTRKPPTAKSTLETNLKSLFESQPKEKSSESFNDSKGTANFRKLYKGRDSPCDLIMLENTSKLSTSRPVLHPALEPVTTTATLPLVYRARTRRKRKKPSLPSSATLSDVVLRQGVPNSSQESPELVQDDKNNNNDIEKEGHERYSEFFESLGLTPKTSLIDKEDNKIVRRRYTRRNYRQLMGTKTGCTTSQTTSPESLESIEKTCGSSEKRERSAVIASNSIEKLRENLGKKILTVRITRLPDQVLARYQQQKSKSSLRFNDVSHHDNSNIEVLTTVTNDSDSSTILIYSCGHDNVDPSYESDYSTKMLSLSSRSVEKAIENGGKNEKSKLPADRTFATDPAEPLFVESSSKISDKLKNDEPRDLVVTFPKLPSNQGANVTRTEEQYKNKPRDLRVKNLNLTTSTTVSSVQPESQDSKAKNLTKSLSRPSIQMENGIGGGELDSRGCKKSRKLENLDRDESDRFSFGFSIKTTSEPDEDCLNSLIREKSLEPHKNRKKSKNSRTVTKREMRNGEMNGGPETNAKNAHKPHSRIVISSDEEEDHPVTFSRTLRSIRSPKKIDTKLTASKRSKNTRKVIDEVVNDLNGEKVSDGSGNSNKSGDGEVTSPSTKNRENSDPRRSKRKRLATTWLNEAVESKNPSGESSDGLKTVESLKNNKFGNLTDINSNFRQEKRKRLENEVPRDVKKSKTTHALKFCTRLSSDSDSNFGFESEKSVAADDKSVRAQSTGPKVSYSEKTLKKRKNVKESEKKSLHLPDEKSPNTASKDLREKTRIPPVRSKTNARIRARETATKKVRRTRILGTAIREESDDDDSKYVKTLANKSTKSKLTINEKACVHPKDANVDSPAPEKLQDYLRTFSPDILDNSILEIDNIFKANGHYQNRNSDEISTKLVKPIVNKNLINTRKSTRTFRTKLTSDSENNDDL